MIHVILYSRKDCHLCEQAQEDLKNLQEVVPHTLNVVDVDQDEKLQKAYGQDTPVVEAGPYKLKGPLTYQDLEIALKAAQHREQQIAEVNQSILSGQSKLHLSWTKVDQFSLFLSRHYLAIFNLFVFFYVTTSFLAPVLMRAGIETPAAWIYKAYSVVCHQFAFRSWFLFGEQIVYPREAAGIDNLITFEQAIRLPAEDLWGARAYIGDDLVGYKIALCERDVSIYLGIFLFGLLFGIAGRKVPIIPWYLWLLLAIIPIGLDGLSQLVSQPPFNWIPYRESSPVLRALTGWLFGYVTAWYGYPLMEESMKDSLTYMESKLRRVQQQEVV